VYSTGPKEVGMQLRVLAKSPESTGTYDCPNIFTTDQGTLAVQGRLLAPGDLPGGDTIPAGEALVEIPADLLLAAARRYNRLRDPGTGTAP
jgi:hypothetical protein